MKKCSIVWAGNPFGGCLPKLLLAALVLLPQTVRGGGWVQDPYKYFALVTYGYFQSGEFFDRTGGRRSVRIAENPSGAFSPLHPATYKQHDGSMYLEFGLPLDFEIDLNIPFYLVAQQDAGSFGTFTARGVSDMSVSLKYLWLFREWLVSSVIFDLGIPLGDDEATGSYPDRVSQPIPLGDGEWDYAIRIFGSRSFDAVPIYVTADFGYRFRNFDIGADDLPWSVEGGYTFWLGGDWFNYITPFANFNGFISLGETSESEAIALGVSRTVAGAAPNQEVVNVRPGLFLGIWKDLSFSVEYNRTLAGKNTSAGWGIRTGLSWNG